MDKGIGLFDFLNIFIRGCFNKFSEDVHDLVHDGLVVGAVVDVGEASGNRAEDIEPVVISAP